MLNAAHVLEVALLLLAAFLVGAVSGSLARVVARRLNVPRDRRAAYQAARVPRVVPDAAVESVPVAVPEAVAPAEPFVIEATAAEPDLTVADAVDQQPVPETTVPEPTPLPEEEALSAAAEPIDAADTDVDEPAIAEPGKVVAPRVEPLADEVPAAAETAKTDSIEAPAAEPAASIIPEPGPAATVMDAQAQVETTPETVSRRRVRLDDDEDESAAMRAIEGNWTPRRRPAKPADAGSAAVAASGAAVAAVVKLAEAVVADAKAPEAVSVDTAPIPIPEPAAPGGRPAGLKSPRHGRKDNLTHVIGVLPIIETSLNSLGLFHFDQVAALSDDNLNWLERHLGIEGRIRREQWREQARELAMALRPTAKVDA